MYCKKLVLISYIFIALTSCGQEKKRIEMKEQITVLRKEVISKIETYDTRPMYAVQINKNKCRVLIKCNDIPHWLTFYENYGESFLAYLNNYIPKSGKQLLTIQVFPKEGDKFIAENANADIRLVYMKDKDDSIQDFENLVELSLPENLGDLELPYYEFTIPFDAVVPFNFSKELETAKDLTKMKNIEEKVLAKYEQLKKMIEKGEGAEYVKQMDNKYTRVQNTLYGTEKELLATLNENDDSDIWLFSSKDVEYRRVPEFKNYEIVFGYNGKLVQLRSIKTKKTMIQIYVGEEYDEPAWDDIFLYIPAGSNELKVW